MAPPARKQLTAVLPDRIGLPNGATISRTALVLPSDFSIEEWQALGTKLGVFENGIQWWLGGWWHYGAHAYGDRKAKVAKDVFPAFATLMNWGWVAGNVATSLRREALSWSHHALIASYPPDEQRKWLDKAEKWEWSVKKLGQKIHEAPDRRSEEERIHDNVRRWAWELEQETSTSRSWYWLLRDFSISGSSRACRHLSSRARQEVR